MLLQTHVGCFWCFLFARARSCWCGNHWCRNNYHIQSKNRWRYTNRRNTLQFSSVSLDLHHYLIDCCNHSFVSSFSLSQWELFWGDFDACGLSNQHTVLEPTFPLFSSACLASKLSDGSCRPLIVSWTYVLLMLIIAFLASTQRRCDCSLVLYHTHPLFDVVLCKCGVWQTAGARAPFIFDIGSDFRKFPVRPAKRHVRCFWQLQCLTRCCFWIGMYLAYIATYCHG